MIELRDVTKSYPTLHGRHYVFRNLNFTFPDDVSIGLIGPNGAGKSTLLRLLGGIDAPDSGEILSDVNISWPVGLTRGMQSSLSARDNVRFVCRLYGAVGADMRRTIRFVEEFAEIGEHFDLPVKTYSSGMRSRVAFGLSMAFEFDYYLIDEATAVGDAQFRRKCNEIFRARLERSNLIFVSHSMGEIRHWCDVVILVKDGQATLYEDVEEGIRAYQGPPDPLNAVRVKRRAARRAQRMAQRGRLPLLPDAADPAPGVAPAPVAALAPHATNVESPPADAPATDVAPQAGPDPKAARAARAARLLKRRRRRAAVAAAKAAKAVQVTDAASAASAATAVPAAPKASNTDS